MKTRHCLYLSLLAVVPSHWATAQTAPSTSSGSSFIEDSKLLLNTRLRYENVDMQGLGDANALTARVRLGVQTGKANGFSGLIDLELTESINGEEHYDAYPGGQGTAGLAPIFDPETQELNQAYVMYEGDGYKAKLGRQRIILDNARFIGNVGWRQNEQTFDAFQLTGGAPETGAWTYAYLDKALRIFGSEAVANGQEEFDSNSHLLNASFKPTSALTLGGYAYLLDLEQAAVASSATYGAYAAGDLNSEGDLPLSYRVEVATQSDYADNPVNYSALYYHLSLSTNLNTIATTVGFESLGSDNGMGFSTPLATLHAFNGFADTYLSTPNGGLDDFYVKAATALPADIKATIVYHWFSGRTTDWTPEATNSTSSSPASSPTGSQASPSTPATTATKPSPTETSSGSSSTSTTKPRLHTDKVARLLRRRFA